MNDPIVVVGSGASAVHFSQTAIELGRQVIMLDVGLPGAVPVSATSSLDELKDTLDDPIGYFLGDHYESFNEPGESSEYYGFPPSKSYVFSPIAGHSISSRGFAPLVSFAAGGLSQAWTGGSYPFSDSDLAEFPFGWDAIATHYSLIAKRIGISGAEDDLTPFIPLHDDLQQPVALDEHATRLLHDYTRRRQHINRTQGFHMGRARLATLSRSHGTRAACSRLGRCLWGCPTESLYTPSITLSWLRQQPGFSYVPAVRVDHFEFDDGQRVTSVVGTQLESHEKVRQPVGTLVLAAGTLASARILLSSMHRAGDDVEISGLMDNRQVLMPFVNLKQIGRSFDDRSYQYHQLAIGVPGNAALDYVHGLVTTLGTSLVHPFVHRFPFGARTSLALFRNVHAALGMVNINFADTRRAENRVAFDPKADAGAGRLLLDYSPASTERATVGPMVQRFRRFLRSLGCIAPRRLTHWRPMGSSVHYAGTLPMLASGGDFTTDASGRCRPFTNLVVADGSTLPVLPSKNLTFTLMANASRLAHETLSS